ncbi:hypothetical protein [Allocoleopsis sp.]|uniref:hypothetical protein n=1 Tax=Allocoleopsis sp. TaxID=3088169 RepID=UPI002FD396B9
MKERLQSKPCSKRCDRVQYQGDDYEPMLSQYHSPEDPEQTLVSAKSSNLDKTAANNCDEDI